MNGKLEDFNKRLEQEKAGNIRKLDVYDSGKKHAYVMFENKDTPWVIYTEGTYLTHTIYRASINTIFKATHRWDYIANMYQQLKDVLIDSYGAPFMDKREFTPPYSETNEPNKAILHGKTNVISKFKDPGGEISLYIKPEETFGGKESQYIILVVRYDDNKGFDTYLSESIIEDYDEY